MRRSRFCRISAIFFQCCFMSETQVFLIFVVFFLGIISWKGASLFNGRVVFHLWSFMFKCGGTPWGISVLMGGGCYPFSMTCFQSFPLFSITCLFPRIFRRLTKSSGMFMVQGTHRTHRQMEKLFFSGSHFASPLRICNLVLTV